jgi:hypothetical protein
MALRDAVVGGRPLPRQQDRTENHFLSKVANGTNIRRISPAIEMIPRMIETIVKSRDPSLKR